MGGVAQLSHTVPTDGSHVVAASYAGDGDFEASADSTSRDNPTITAAISSATAPVQGWYSGPVTVTFSCTTHGVDLTEPCPAPVTLSGSGSVTRTITAADGGMASVTATAAIDLAGPTVKITGFKAGKTYPGKRTPRCVAVDQQSGVASCRLTTKRRGASTTVTATATDIAGNTATATASYRVATVGATIEGAKKVKGVYQVRRGKTYTVVVKGAKARYLYAVPASRRPHAGRVPFKAAGKNRWALGVTMDMSTARTRTWNLGYLQNGKRHVIKVHVLG